ncbi:MAG: hypothetical protein ACJ8M4_09500 [Chthoniobacterales bacterium]
MGSLKPKMGASLREIRTILLREWDPIGVRDIPGAHDEYDSYAMPLYLFLRSKPSADAVVDHLYRLETRQMGLTRFGRGHLKPIADRLLKLDLSTDEPLQ